VITQQSFDELKAAAIPIAVLTASPHGLAEEFADVFKTAAVVFYFDVTRPDDLARANVIHGRGMLQEIAHGSRARGHVVCVSLNPATDELELLAACCTVHRGGYDRESFGRRTPPPATD